MTVDRFFSGQELAAVEAAVRAAEGESGGEIVPYVVDASDAYPEAAWVAAALGAVALPLLTALAHWAAGWWGVEWTLWMIAPPVVGAAGGYLAAVVIPALRRALVPAAVRQRRVEGRAAAAFVDEEVFATRDRTGILLFVSLFERRVVVLADAGIHARVPEGAWQGIVDRLVAGLRAGRPGSALAEAVAACGALLAERGVPLRPDDIDELSDRVRREER